MDFYPLLSRKTLQISGPDRKDFLQGLITCDIHKLSEESSLYGVFLTPKGRIKAPFFLFESDDCLLLDLPSVSSEEIRKYLLRMKLRNRLEFTFSPLKSFACISQESIPKSSKKIAKDPRFPKLGWRGLYEGAESIEFKNNASEIAYREHLAGYGVADDATILSLSKESYPSELNLDLLNAISWTKGCYTGQEVTARFYHRSLTKRRLLPLTLPFSLQEKALSAETYLYNEKDDRSGKIIYTDQSQTALAMIEKKYWNESVLFFDSCQLEVKKPDFFSSLK